MNFANKLSAQMLGITEQQYIEAHEDIISKVEEVEKFVDNFEVKNIEDYKEGLRVKSVLSSLSCYVFNNNKEEWEKFFDIEGKLGKKLHTYEKNKKSKETSNLCVNICCGTVILSTMIPTR